MFSNYLRHTAHPKFSALRIHLLIQNSFKKGMKNANKEKKVHLKMVVYRSGLKMKLEKHFRKPGELLLKTI